MSKDHTLNHNEKYDIFIGMFDSFFRHGVMISTYKAVFLRSFIDIGRYEDDGLVGKQWIHNDGETIKLDLDFIAIRFAKYYWDMEASFKMRHTPERMADHNHPEKDINIIRIIHDKIADIRRKDIIIATEKMDSKTLNELPQIYDVLQKDLEEIKPPTLNKLAENGMAEFRDTVIRDAIKPEVLKNILKDMPNLYESKKGEKYIVFDLELAKFMKKTAYVINRALNYIIALHLEQYNPSAVQIATKINDEKLNELKITRIKNVKSQIEQESDQFLESVTNRNNNMNEKSKQKMKQITKQKLQNKALSRYS